MQVTYCAAVPLLLLDLDNTLIDRAGAFKSWAESFLAEIGAPEYDVPWLLDVDAESAGEIIELSACDPLNLVGVLTPGPRIPATLGNVVIYRDGVPLAPLGESPSRGARGQGGAAADSGADLGGAARAC